MVIGGANMDLKATSGRPIVDGTSNPGSTSISPGGVARNIAENLARLGTTVELVSVVGADSLGAELLERTSAAGVDVSGVRSLDGPTGTYTAVLDVDGELVVAIADMGAADDITPDLVAEQVGTLRGRDLLVLDGNLPTDTVAAAVDQAGRAGARIVFEPVSVPKAARCAAVVDGVWLVTPNRDELAALAGPQGTMDDQITRLHDRGISRVWVRLGTDGSLLSTPTGRHRLAARTVEVIDVTGAGDAMLGAFCHALLRGDDEVAAAAYGHAAAALTVASPQTVRSDMNEGLIKDWMDR
ncbi:PfkB family carbohydrate kinase [soil metagenome]